MTRNILGKYDVTTAHPLHPVHAVQSFLRNSDHSVHSVRLAVICSCLHPNDCWTVWETTNLRPLAPWKFQGRSKDSLVAKSLFQTCWHKAYNTHHSFQHSGHCRYGQSCSYSRRKRRHKSPASGGPCSRSVLEIGSNCLVLRVQLSPVDLHRPKPFHSLTWLTLPT